MTFQYATIATAPSPAATGTSLTLSSGGGALMPSAPFNLVVWSAGQLPDETNAEVVRVTAIATDTLTITRNGGRHIAVGWQAMPFTEARGLADVRQVLGSVVAQLLAAVLAGLGGGGGGGGDGTDTDLRKALIGDFGGTGALAFIGEWEGMHDSGAGYAIGDVVTQDGISFQNLIAGNIANPLTGQGWRLLSKPAPASPSITGDGSEVFALSNGVQIVAADTTGGDALVTLPNPNLQNPNDPVTLVNTVGSGDITVSPFDSETVQVTTVAAGESVTLNAVGGNWVATALFNTGVL